jgi:hypothetical protein
MICVESSSVIDATEEGVQARNIQPPFFEDECAIYILRSRGSLNAQQLNNLCNYARQCVGTEYSTIEALRTKLGGGGFTRKQFCSRLVAQAYVSIGVGLIADPKYCSPEDLKNSSQLTRIDAPPLPVTEQEVSAWEKSADATRKMRDATNPACRP